MSPRTVVLACVAAAGLLTAVAVQAGGGVVSRDQAETFARKVALIVQHGTTSQAAGLRRTTLTEAEMNSWFAFRGGRLLPTGVSSPTVSLGDNGRVTGVATLDLEEISRRRERGSFDVLSFLGGQVPVTVSGVLHTSEGRGRFELQEAAAGGVPVPKFLVQELVALYTRTPDDPEGMGLDRPFDLPVNIRQIELGQGQATVVQ